MDVVQSNYGPPISGVGTLRLVGKGKSALARIVIDKKGQFEVPASELPKQIVAAGRYMFRLSAQGDRLWGAYPEKGQFKVRFYRMAAGKDKAPRPWSFTSSQFGTTKLCFTALVEVIEGPYKGLELPVMLDYKFGADGKGNATIQGRGKHTEELINFITYSGVDLAALKIPASENVLTDLEDVLLKSRKPFYVTFDKGYFRGLAPVFDAGRSTAKKAKGRRIL